MHCLAGGAVALDYAFSIGLKSSGGEAPHYHTTQLRHQSESRWTQLAMCFPHMEVRSCECGVRSYEIGVRFYESESVRN